MGKQICDVKYRFFFSICLFSIMASYPRFCSCGGVIEENTRVKGFLMANAGSRRSRLTDVLAWNSIPHSKNRTNAQSVGATVTREVQVLFKPVVTTYAGTSADTRCCAARMSSVVITLQPLIHVRCSQFKKCTALERVGTTLTRALRDRQY